MTNYYLRIITDCATQAAGQLISDYLNGLPGITGIHTEAVQPYWKNPGQGEISVSFVSALSMEQIQAMLGDHWEGENADIRWSRIHVPHAVFLWLCCETQQICNL